MASEIYYACDDCGGEYLIKNISIDPATISEHTICPVCGGALRSNNNI